MEVVLSWSALDAQGASCAKPLRTPGHDLDGDGCITIFDVQLVSARIGGVTNAARASAFEDAISALAAGPLTMTVNSTGDAVDANPGDAVCSTSGNVCTLRAAVMEANARPGAENIHFNIPGSGVREIRLYSDLPTISDQTGAVVIDGFTQPGSSPNTNAITQGSNAVIRVQIVGNGNSGPSAFRISHRTTSSAASRCTRCTAKSGSQAPKPITTSSVGTTSESTPQEPAALHPRTAVRSASPSSTPRSTTASAVQVPPTARSSPAMVTTASTWTAPAPSTT